MGLNLAISRYKYALSSGLVLNQKEVQVELSDEEKLVNSLANVIRSLTRG